jgi:hypothetical protein
MWKKNVTHEENIKNKKRITGLFIWDTRQRMHKDLENDGHCCVLKRRWTSS